ncbi:hypothetical protein [Arthrobacter sp. KK5.5]|uniref:hypothetical protein n=1 Tax=Arthrobacter sp. KK5.5 TaxID=3373084 RepID=UPI003EE5A854
MRLRAPVAVAGPVPSGSGAEKVADRLHLFGADSFVWREGRGYALDGVGIVGDKAITTASDAAATLPGPATTLTSLADRWGATAKNPCCLLVADREVGRVLLLPDPLGGSLAWRLDAPPYDLVSSDIVSLVSVARTLGVAPGKSVDFQLERMVLGNGGLTPSSYDGVERLGLFGYWTVGAKGAEAREYAAGANARDSDLSYGDALAAVRKDITESVAALAGLSAEHRVAHLTGGFDSRLVLGAILETGTRHAFSFFCSGPEGTHDRAVADGLTGAFGLRRTSGAGLSPTPLTAIHEQLTAPMYYSGGLTSSGPVGGELPQRVVALGGGYGEVLRSWYSVRWPDAPRISTEPLLLLSKLTGQQPTADGLLNQAAYMGVGSRLQDEWNTLGAEGYPEDFIGDAMYSQVRNRYHIGQNAVLWSRIGARFDPLYSVAGFAAARSLPLESRSANVLGMDLMRGFEGGLAGYPFDKNRFSTAYLRQRRSPAPRQFPDPSRIGKVSAYRPPHGPVDGLPTRLAELAVEAPELTPAARQDLVGRANSLGVNFWQLSCLPGAQSALRTAASTVDLEPLASVLDLAYLRHLGAYKARTRQEVRGVYSALTLLTWLGID